MRYGSLIAAIALILLVVSLTLAQWIDRFISRVRKAPVEANET